MLFIRLLVKMIAPRVHVRASKDITAFDFTTNTLYYNAQNTADSFGFMRHLREEHHADPKLASPGVWAVLHELGHYFTDDFAEDDLQIRALCAMCDEETARDSKIIQDLYYSIPCEWEATEWAIDWVEAHPRLSSLFSALL